MAKMDELMKAKRNELENEASEWIDEALSEAISEWEEKNPQPDEDEEGMYAIEEWEKERERLMIEEEGRLADFYYNKVLPEALERYEDEISDSIND